MHLSTGNFKKNSKKIKSLNFCDDSMQKGDFEDEHPGTWIPEDTAKRNPLDRCISLRDTKLKNIRGKRADEQEV